MKAGNFQSAFSGSQTYNFPQIFTITALGNSLAGQVSYSGEQKTLDTIGFSRLEAAPTKDRLLLTLWERLPAAKKMHAKKIKN